VVQRRREVGLTINNIIINYFVPPTTFTLGWVICYRYKRLFPANPHCSQGTVPKMNWGGAGSHKFIIMTTEVKIPTPGNSHHVPMIRNP